MTHIVLQGVVLNAPILIYDFSYMSTTFPGNKENPSRLRLYMVQTSEIPNDLQPRVVFSTPHLQQESTMHGHWEVLFPATPATHGVEYPGCGPLPLCMFRVSFNFASQTNRMKTRLFIHVKHTQIHT